MTAARFWTGFVLLAAMIFGALGYAAWLVATLHPWAALALVIAVWVGGGTLSWFVAWLVMLGHKPSASTLTDGRE